MVDRFFRFEKMDAVRAILALDVAWQVGVVAMQEIWDNLEEQRCLVGIKGNRFVFSFLIVRQVSLDSFFQRRLDAEGKLMYVVATNTVK